MLALKLARVKRGWTQEKLSKESGVGRATICNIEKNGVRNTHVHILERLATTLGVKVTELFFSDQQ